MKLAAPLAITEDTREQTPLDWASAGLGNAVAVTRGTVPVFDYALTGDEAGFAVERKSLTDFVGCMASPDAYLRERRKVHRAIQAGISPVVYVVEAHFTQLFIPSNFLRFGAQYAKCTSTLVISRWRDLVVGDGVLVHWAGDAEHAARAVYALLKARHNFLNETTHTEET